MKAAIYSRLMDDEQQNDVQSFFDELANQKIGPVIFHDFFDLPVHQKMIAHHFAAHHPSTCCKLLLSFFIIV